VHRIHYRFGLVLALLVVTIAFSLAAPRETARGSSS
jgi:hypothetical protein